MTQTKPPPENPGRFIALLVGEAHGQFARAQPGLFQRHLDDLVLDVVADAISYPAWRRWRGETMPVAEQVGFECQKVSTYTQ